jgi:putative transcriptional regulator
MQSLENHFLIAMPNMQDPAFEHSVTYICEHNDQGAMGLVINQPIDLTVGELLDQIKIDNNKETDAANIAVFSGGPVQQEQGFVLHIPKEGYQSSLKLTNDVMITTSKDVLTSLTTELAPEKFLISLGYAGWGSGQLEQELMDNAWLTIEADPEIIFSTPAHLRWEKAIEMLGIDITKLSTQTGHA